MGNVIKVSINKRARNKTLTMRSPFMILFDWSAEPPARMNEIKMPGKNAFNLPTPSLDTHLARRPLRRRLYWSRIHFCRESTRLFAPCELRRGRRRVYDSQWRGPIGQRMIRARHNRKCLNSSVYFLKTALTLCAWEEERIRHNY